MITFLSSYMVLQTMKGWKSVSFVLAAVLLLGALSMSAMGADPEIKRGLVAPRESDDEALYIFTTTYLDPDNDTPEFVTLFIDGAPHKMTPVDPDDDNYTDGRDYEYRTKLGEGTYTFFFRVVICRRCRSLIDALG